MGIRTQVQIEVLTERYADYGQVGFLAWWRGDVRVARPAAFDITTGVRPRKTDRVENGGPDLSDAMYCEHNRTRVRCEDCRAGRPRATQPHPR